MGCFLTDFHFSLSLLPEDKSLHNLMMVKKVISSNTSVNCHFDPHLVLLSAHVKLNDTIATALELNIFVFLSSLFLYFRKYISEHPVKQSSDDDPTTQPFTGNKLTKRKDLQKGIFPANKPPSGYSLMRNSREGVTHTVSDSSLYAHCVDTSTSGSLVSLIDFTKDSSENTRYNVGVTKSSSKHQITASTESLNTAQFETHTSLRIKRPPSGQVPKECFVNKTAKVSSFQDSSFTDKPAVDTSGDVSSDHGQDKNRSFASCSHSNSSKQLETTAILADHTSYCWLVKTLSLHGVTLETGNNAEDVIPVDVQDVSMVSYVCTN